jgi:hypothetical protein
MRTMDSLGMSFFSTFFPRSRSYYRCVPISLEPFRDGPRGCSLEDDFFCPGVPYPLILNSHHPIYTPYHTPTQSSNDHAMQMRESVEDGDLSEHSSGLDPASVLLHILLERTLLLVHLRV